MANDRDDHIDPPFSARRPHDDSRDAEYPSHRDERRKSKKSKKSRKAKASRAEQVSGVEEFRSGRNRKRHKYNPQKDFMDFVRHMDHLEHADGEIPDAVAQNLVATFGTAPVFAMSESYLALSQAQSLMMTNQVSNQQRMNYIGMYTTAKCVAEMFNVNNPWMPLVHDHMAHKDDDDDHHHNHEHHGTPVM